MRHGLTGHTVLLPAEDLVAYQDFTRGFFVDLKPVGMVERQLVQSLADTSWRLNRIPALERLTREFRNRGLNLDLPYLNPGSVDRYELP